MSKAQGPRINSSSSIAQFPVTIFLNHYWMFISALIQPVARQSLPRLPSEGGEGRGEEALLWGWPLSPALSLLVSRGARETNCSLFSIAFSGPVRGIKCIIKFFFRQAVARVASNTSSI